MFEFSRYAIRLGLRFCNEAAPTGEGAGGAGRWGWGSSGGGGGGGEGGARGGGGFGGGGGVPALCNPDTFGPRPRWIGCQVWV